jgi:hypothetical protein
MTGDRTCRHCGRPLDSSTVYQLTEIAGEFCSAVCLFAAKGKVKATPLASGDSESVHTLGEPGPCCWACHQPLLNGSAVVAHESAALLVPIGSRIEIRTTAGTRVGRMVGYLEDGGVEVHIDGQTFIVAATAVSLAPDVAQIPAPAAVP